MVPEHGAFIVGVARSGTSLLVRLLDGHPQVVTIPGETFLTEWSGAPDPVAAFFEVSRLGRQFPLDAPERPALEAALRARLAGPCGVREGMRALLDALQPLLPDAPQARVWLEKTPRHRHRLPLLLRAFGPQTRIVGIVRDPRSVIASQAGRWAERFARRSNMRRFAQVWACTDVHMRRYEGEPRFLLLRYEDLVSDTEGSMRQVAQHLGIDWDACLLAPTRAGASWSGNSSTGEIHEGVSDRSTTRYRELLEPGEIRQVEQLLGPRMRHHGYAPESAGGSSPWRAFIELGARRRSLRDLRICRHDPPRPRPDSNRSRTRQGAQEA